MEVTYTLFYHPLVVSEDIPRINPTMKKRLAKAIQERLSSHPESYGKPLSGTLASYWKLRVGDYRVVYKIVKQEVWIFAIIYRRDVYEEVLQRLSWRK